MTKATASIFAVLFLSATAYAADDDMRKSIIDHCRNMMGEFGASLVKVCVDQDIRAYEALASYDPKHRVIIDRCRSMMLSTGGWNIVQVCVDQDIEAERALENY